MSGQIRADLIGIGIDASREFASSLIMPNYMGQGYATRRVFVFIVGCLLTVFVGPGCTKSPKDKLVGVWKYVEGKNSLMLTFRADKTAVLSFSGDQSRPDTFTSWRMPSPTTVAIGNSPLELSIVALGPTELDVRLPSEMNPSSNLEVVTFVRISDDPLPPSAGEKFARSPEEQVKVVTSRKIDVAVRDNARQLSAAADQLFLETKRTEVGFDELVGPDKYVKSVKPIAGEHYPDLYTKGVTLTITDVEGARTVTYAP